jgi:hypothetical protein
MCRFSDAGNDGAIGALMRPASEKRQGTKSRTVMHPKVQRTLWGFGGGVDCEEFELKQSNDFLSCRLLVCVSG